MELQPVSLTELEAIEGGRIRPCDEDMLATVVEYNNGMGYIGQMYSYTITITETPVPC